MAEGGDAMPKGGARARSGPAPDPNSLRSADGDWTVLPLGRTGPVPEWPMPPNESFPAFAAREAVVWADLWSLPQAILWERNHQERLVALYVRRMVEAETPASPVNLSTLVRQLADELMLTTSGMLRSRVKIEAPKEGAADGASARPSNRARLTVVDGGT